MREDFCRFFTPRPAPTMTLRTSAYYVEKYAKTNRLKFAPMHSMVRYLNSLPVNQNRRRHLMVQPQSVQGVRTMAFPDPDEEELEWNEDAVLETENIGVAAAIALAESILAD